MAVGVLKTVVQAHRRGIKEFFKILLRTGMQRREVTGKSHYTTLLRRMSSGEGVFETAYAKAIQTYKKHVPTKFHCHQSIELS